MFRALFLYFFIFLFYGIYLLMHCPFVGKYFPFGWSVDKGRYVVNIHGTECYWRTPAGWYIGIYIGYMVTDTLLLTVTQWSYIMQHVDTYIHTRSEDVHSAFYYFVNKMIQDYKRTSVWYIGSHLIMDTIKTMLLFSCIQPNRLIPNVNNKL